MAIHFPTARLTASAVAALLASASYAQQTSSNATTLDDTVVTATRVETQADQLISDVTVITSEQIERSSGLTLPQILQRFAGVQINTYGGRGKLTGVSVRGTESRHTLLLIDGVRYGSATAGSPVWENIPLDSIERIEVLQGPASSLYGSDAVGGVIQIFTRRGLAKDGVLPYANVTLGSHQYKEAAAGVRGRAGSVAYSLNASALNDHGFSAMNENEPYGNFNADRDGFRQRAVDASFDWDLTQDWTLSAGVLRSDGVTYLDDGPGANALTDIDSTVGRLAVRGRLNDIWTSRLSYNQSRDKSEAKVSATPWGFPALFETRQDQLTWQNDVDTAIGTVVAGVERLEQRVDSSTAYDVRKRSINSVFAGLNGAAGRHYWQANVRRDHNSQFGGKTTGLLGYGYQLLPSLRARASYGTSFVAPSFNDLYYPGYSNPKLEPETGRNGEVGLTWTAGGQNLSATYFHNKIRGFITSGAHPVNIPYAVIKGWTLGYQTQIDGWNLYSTVDLIDPRNKLTGLQLPRRAKRQLTAGVDYTWSQWTFGASLLSQSKRYDTDRTPLGGYTTADLYASYAVARDWTVQARLNNIADKDYTTAYGYNQPGREFYLTLRWQPK